MLGAALYRSGQYEESIQCFEDAAETFRPRAWDWSFLAMAHHRLGNANEARRCLLGAERWITEANTHPSDDISDGTNAGWGSWNEKVTYPLLYREAELLIESGQ